MISKLTSDVSAITSIPKLTLEKLMDKYVLCICNSIQEALLKKENLIELDIHIGILNIKIEESAIKYKFIPSKKLEDNIAFTTIHRKSPLIIELENSLQKRIEETYKGLL